ncbi:hypothetical protein SESBI_24230 [Sesbania bispinosa]|nr:hypothetical protein SESBI_24230 [Sesbania bispinosa]
MYLVNEENSLDWVKLIWLNPRLASKIDALYNAYAFQEDLRIIAIDDGNSSRNPKSGSTKNSTL